MRVDNPRTLLATLGVALIALCVGCFENPPALPSLEPPPESVPDAYLLFGNTPDSEPLVQLGTLTAYDWLLEGEVSSYRMSFPRQYPSALNLSSRDTPVLRIETSAVPATIDVSYFEYLGPDSVPEGDSVSIKKWQNPRIFSHAREHGDDRTLVYRKKGENGGWEVKVPFATSFNKSLIVVWATWLDPDDPTKGPYSVNWHFVVQE